MKLSSTVLCDFHFTTIGGSISLSPYVAKFLDHIDSEGLPYNLHAFGTNVEAPLEKIFELTRWIMNLLEVSGEKRLFIDIRLTQRFDREQSISEKISAVAEKLRG